MKSKRGILMPETLKIIIAVMCIALLMYLAVKLIGIFLGDTSLEQAKGNLDKLHAGISSVETGKESVVEVPIESPNDWWIIAWPYKDFELDGKRVPENCKRNCICICPIPGLDSTKEQSFEVCEDEGVCEETSLFVKTLYSNAPDSWWNKVKNFVISKTGLDNVPLRIDGFTPVVVYKERDSGREIIIVKKLEEEIVVDDYDFILNVKKEQLNDADPELITLLNCMNKEYIQLEGKKIVVTSITDDGLYGEDATCDLKYDGEKFEDDGNCVHTKTSCHYYLDNEVLQSRAADIRSTRDYDYRSLYNAYSKCKKEGYQYKFEPGPKEHLHVELSGDCGLA